MKKTRYAARNRHAVGEQRAATSVDRAGNSVQGCERAGTYSGARSRGTRNCAARRIAARSAPGPRTRSDPERQSGRGVRSLPATTRCQARAKVSARPITANLPAPGRDTTRHGGNDQRVVQTNSEPHPRDRHDALRRAMCTCSGDPPPGHVASYAASANTSSTRVNRMDRRVPPARVRRANRRDHLVEFRQLRLGEMDLTGPISMPAAARDRTARAFPSRSRAATALRTRAPRRTR